MPRVLKKPHCLQSENKQSGFSRLDCSLIKAYKLSCASRKSSVLEVFCVFWNGPNGLHSSDACSTIFRLAFQCLIKVLQWTGLYISVVHYPSHKSQNKLTPNIVVSAYQLNFEGNRNVFFLYFFSSQGEGWRMQWRGTHRQPPLLYTAEPDGHPLYCIMGNVVLGSSAHPPVPISTLLGSRANMMQTLVFVGRLQTEEMRWDRWTGFHSGTARFLMDLPVHSGKCSPQLSRLMKATTCSSL